MKIQYRNNEVRKLCTDYRKAKRAMPEKVAVSLHQAINFLQNAKTLEDLKMMRALHLHALQGEREGQFVLDLAGRRSGYRLILIPLDAEGQEWNCRDVQTIYVATEVILIWEVSNHYE